jgi:glycogen debranching enzyme
MSDPYPIRAVCDPIPEESFLWRPYMLRHRQNLPWQYHNGGIWPFVGAFWAMALKSVGDEGAALAELEQVAAANALARWRFSEWLHGETLEPAGMAGQSWNAAAFLLALHAFERKDGPFPGPHAGSGEAAV